MRGLREHPRLAVASVLGAICLVLIGVAISAVDGRGDGDRIKSTESRLAAANQASTARASSCEWLSGAVGKRRCRSRAPSDGSRRSRG